MGQQAFAQTVVRCIERLGAAPRLSRLAQRAARMLEKQMLQVVASEAKDARMDLAESARKSALE